MGLQSKVHYIFLSPPPLAPGHFLNDHLYWVFFSDVGIRYIIILMLECSFIWCQRHNKPINSLLVWSLPWSSCLLLGKDVKWPPASGINQTVWSHLAIPANQGLFGNISASLQLRNFKWTLYIHCHKTNVSNIWMTFKWLHLAVTPSAPLRGGDADNNIIPTDYSNMQ